MRQRIAHMIQYKYIPFSHGKVKYGGKHGEGPPGGAPGIKNIIVLNSYNNNNKKQQHFDE